eukprot:Nk52_evm34s317 gene=Nk52_evmTU34s317
MTRNEDEEESLHESIMKILLDPSTLEKMTGLLGAEHGTKEKDGRLDAEVLPKSEWFANNSFLDMIENLEELNRDYADQARESDGLQSASLAGKRSVMPTITSGYFIYNLSWAHSLA